MLLCLVHCVQFKLLHLKKNVMDLEKFQKDQEDKVVSNEVKL